MRGTERYHQARLAKAKPVVLAYVGSDTAMRCFGKQTPQEAWLDSAYNAVEWRACVLSFGDFREALTAESSEMFSALVETEMTAYTLTLDNADGYFTRLAGREQLLGGRLILMQGFDWPDFAASDFLPLFYGLITGFKNTNKQTVINADQALKAETPEEPDTDSTVIYGLYNESITNSAAEEEFTHEELAPFISQESWEITIEIVRDAEVEEKLLEIVESTSGNPSVEIGINGDGNYYLTYSEDITVAETKTITGPAAGEGQQRVTVALTNDGNIVIDDGSGVSISTGLDTADSYEYDSEIVADVNLGQGIAVDVNGNIYVACTDKYIRKYNSSGVLQNEFSTGAYTPNRIALDSYGNMYVTAGSSNCVLKYNSSGSLVTQWGSYGSGNGEFSCPVGIAISPTNGAVYVVDSSNNRIQMFDTGGSYLGQWGSHGSGNGEFEYALEIYINSLGSVFVVEGYAGAYGNCRVQAFTDAGSYSYQWGSYGTGDGQFGAPDCITCDVNGHFFVGDHSQDKIHHFNAAHAFIEKISYGSGLYYFGLATDTVLIDDELEDVLYAVNYKRGGEVQRFMSTVGEYIPPDFTSTSNSLMKLLNGNTNTTIASVVVKGEDGTPVMAYENVGLPTATVFDEIIGDGTLDLPLEVDADWEAFGYVDTYTATVTDTVQEFTVEEVTDLNTTDLYTVESGEKLDSHVLPLPYGDLIENSDAGVWIAPCLRPNDLYCVAGWPILTVENGNAISVYVDGVRREDGWRFVHDDFQSQGEIALILFEYDFPESESIVTVRCKGKVDDAGDLITNPIDVIEDFLNYIAEKAGMTWIPNAASFAKAKNDAAVYGYTCAGVITENIKLGEWLQNLLNSFLGAFRFNFEGELEVWLQPMSLAEEVHEEILEYEAISLEAEQSAENICRQVILHYALSLTGADKAYYRLWREAASRTVGDVWELSFDWCRNTDTIGMIVNILLSLYADPEWVINYQGQDCKFLPLDMRDQVEATLSLVVDENGAVVADVPYSLREKTVNLDDFTTTLIAQSVNFIQLAANPPGAVYISWDRVYINGDPVFIERVL